MPQSNMPINNVILEKLEALDNRLNKLDSIESQINNLTLIMGLMDQRVSTIESKLQAHNNKCKLIEM
jgi:hypothetical protein